LLVENTNSGKLKNEGSFEVSQTPSIGWKNYGYMNNTGNLTIDSATVGISNYGKILNSELAIFHIKNNSTTDLLNWDTFINHGQAILEGTPQGIHNWGEVANYGKINLSEITNDCILNNSTIYNATGGLIQIEEHLGVFGNGIKSQPSGNLVNHGKIMIDSVPGAGIKGPFENYDTVKISNTGSAGIDNSSLALVNNRYISILNADQQGIIAKFMTNNGQIVIAGTTLLGLQISRSLTNSPLADLLLSSTGGVELLTLRNHGTVQIDSSHEVGITMFDTLENHHSIIIERCAAQGLYSFGHVLNSPSGAITIGNTYIGIQHGAPTHGSDLSLFENFGTVTLTDCQDYGLHIRDEFINAEEGQIIISNTSDRHWR